MVVWYSRLVFTASEIAPKAAHCASDRVENKTNLILTLDTALQFKFGSRLILCLLVSVSKLQKIS